MKPRFYPKKRGSCTADERRLKAEYRLAHPICEACRIEATAHAHHIVTEGSHGVTEEWNLIGLCVPCHLGVFHNSGWRKLIVRFPHLKDKIIAAREKQGRKVE